MNLAQTRCIPCRRGPVTTREDPWLWTTRASLRACREDSSSTPLLSQRKVFQEHFSLRFALCVDFWSEVQRVYENCIWTSLPSSLRIAWNGVLKPRHFLGVRLAVKMMSWISSSDTLSMSI